MSFNTDTIDKIVGYKTIKKRDKIDRLLEIESNYIANNIGCNISKTEKNNIRKIVDISIELYQKLIKK